MKKKFLLVIIGIIFLALVIFGFLNWQAKRLTTVSEKPKIEEEKIVYSNSNYGYELEIPKDWQGKFEIEERENATVFVYSVLPEFKTALFSIIVYPKSEWENLKNEPGYHGFIITEKEENVFVYTLPLENPYEKYPDKAEEFQKMVGQVKEIMATFKIKTSSEVQKNCGEEKEKVNRNPLTGRTDLKCCQGLIEWRVSRSFSYCLKPRPEGLMVDLPRENEKIKSPLKIKGQARGFWFFEAEFLAQLFDEEENLLGTAILTAKEDWMTENFVPFEGELIFEKPKKNNGFLRFWSANPAGLPEYQRVLEMPIQFEEGLTRKVLLYYYNPEKDKDEEGNVKCSRDGLVPIEKEIPLTKTPLQETIRLLLKGKENLTKEAIEQGVTTEYPLEGFTLKSASLKDGVLTLHFDDPLNKTSGGSCRVGILWFQIEATAKQFPEVKQVHFLPEEIFQP